MDVLDFIDTLEVNSNLGGDLHKMANLHIEFYKFYISFASESDALVFDSESLNYLKSCIDFLQNKVVSRKSILQSQNNILKMLDSLDDLCISLGGDKKMLGKIREIYEIPVEAKEDGDEKQADGTLSLLKQLKNLLNDPIEPSEERPTDQGNTEIADAGRFTPNSERSSSPDQATASMGSINSMAQYFLTDRALDGDGFLYREFKNSAMTHEMNSVMSRVGHLRESKYNGLDNMIAKMKINVPLWNYNIDSVEAIDSNIVLENLKIFEGTKSVTEAVLYSSPDFFNVGPFEVYLQNKVFVYHCLVNKCNNCLTTSLEYLKTHVKFSHGDSVSDWSCSACEIVHLHSLSQKSLDGALDHLAKYHSVKTTYALSKERLLEINKNIATDNSTISTCPEVRGATKIDDINLFHCPMADCNFSTNTVDEALVHFCSIPNKKIVFNCHCCSLILHTLSDYCEHLLKTHGNSRYKCGYCPYRTISKANIVFHQRDKHSSLSHKIYGFEPINNAEYSYDCRACNSIKPFECKNCNFKSLIEQKFTNHLLTHSGISVPCNYCSSYETEDISELRDHLLIHGVGEYQCIYCLDAFNFISKIQHHLYENHPTQYPFIIICQDFDSRSLSLKGKYNKIQKLNIGDESIILLPLESDQSIYKVQIIDNSDSIVIGDVDHCKMQMKVFMKNVCEDLPEPNQPSYSSPTVTATIDLTDSEEPRLDIKPRIDFKPRVDIKPREDIKLLEDIKPREEIKPRLRIKPIEELLINRPLGQLESESSGKISENISDLSSTQVPQASFSSFDLPPFLLQGTTLNTVENPDGPLLTPAQIKSEFVRGAIEDANAVASILTETSETVIDKQISDSFLSAQIKKEKHVDSVCAKNDVESSKKKTTPVASSAGSRSIRIKLEEPGSCDEGELVIDERDAGTDGILERDSIQKVHEEINQRIGLPLMESSQQEFLPHKDTASSNNSDALSDRAGENSNDNNLPIIESIQSLRAMSGGVYIRVSSPNKINEIETCNTSLDALIPGEGSVSLDLPVLSASSIDDMAIDFGCVVDLQANKAMTVRNDAGNHPLYRNPTVIDTVIISDEEEDSPRPSIVIKPMLAPEENTAIESDIPKIISTQQVPSVPSTSTANMEIDNAVSSIRIASMSTISRSSQEMFASESSTFKIINLNATPTSNVNVTRKQPNSAKIKFRCTLCDFKAAMKSEIYEHLYLAHTERKSQDQPSPPKRKETGGTVSLLGVSCPYCPERVFQGIKQFERHHSQEHGDFSEVKCFFIYPPQSGHSSKVILCSFCGFLCNTEDEIRKHSWSFHDQRLKMLKPPFTVRTIVALKKMVCPLYNCLEEFLEPAVFIKHMKTHKTVIACKTCTYIADTAEAFHTFHNELDPVERLTHFFYNKTEEEISKLISIQRFSNPLYRLVNSMVNCNINVYKNTARKSMN